MSCSVENCEKKIYARGWCRQHYRHVVEGGHSQPLPVLNSLCGCGKELNNKAGTSGLCRECYYKKWKTENHSSQTVYKKEYNIKNKDKLKQQHKNWRINNKDRINAQYAEKRKDPQYRLAHNLRSRLYDFLAGKIKHKRTEELTSCSFEELKKHLESQFKPDMTWNNYGNYWCVDHEIPLISASPDDKIALEKLCHYSNLRPLTIAENNAKASQDKLWKKT